MPNERACSVCWIPPRHPSVTDRFADFTAPVPLADHHDLSGFDSEEPVLDDWLRQRAMRNMKSAATKTYVICPAESATVIGYYALCMGQMLATDVTGSMRRNMPGQIPAVLLGRLAIDHDWQGRGLGGYLLRDVVRRARRAAEEIPARLIIVHAISPAAEAFYRHYGFTRLPIEAPTLALDLAKLAKLEENR